MLFADKHKSFISQCVLGALSVFAFFFGLGNGEIQSWDEGLYLVRANAIRYFACWIDQTQYAIGGLYSSTHPPLVIWFFTINRAIFGDSEYASRLVCAISAVIAVIFFYKLSCLLVSQRSAFFGSILLATAQGFVNYSHKSQLDIPLLMFIVLAVYFTLRSRDEIGMSSVILATIFFAGALLTKAFQGLYALPFFLALSIVFSRKDYGKKIVLITIGGFLIAMPWYLMMMLRHPNFFAEYTSLLSSMKAGTYASASQNQWWYYINQVVVFFPLLSLLPIVINRLLRTNRTRTVEAHRLRILSTVWFVSLLMFFFFFPISNGAFCFVLASTGSASASVCNRRVLYNDS